MKKFNLWLFDGEGTAPEGSDGGAENAAQDELATQEQDVRYGKQAEEAKPEDSKAQYSYEQFKEKFKEDYQKDVDKMISKRLKGSKKTEKERDALKERNDALMDILGARYGTDDYDELLGKLREDKSYIEAQALEKGVSVEEYEAQLRADKLQKDLNQRDEQERNAKIVSDWQRQGEELKALYPEFNLDEEYDNEIFGICLQAGLPVRTAYQAAHFDDILSGVIEYTAAKVKSSAAKAKAQRQARPSENGTRSTAAAIVKNDVSKLSKHDMDEIDKKVLRGERISF